MDLPREQLVRESVARYVDATSAGDTATADHARGVVGELCLDAVRKAAIRVLKPLDNDVDDVVATAQMTFFDILPDHMLRFDPSKVITLQSGKRGTFAGWVLYGCPSWGNAVRRELERSNGMAGINAADQQMQRIYHGCRERFVALHGRDWTPQEAHAHVAGYLHETTRDRYLDRHPDWDEQRLDDAAKARITKDGHMRTLRELDEVVRLQAAARAASLDAPYGAGSDQTLGETLAGTLGEPDEPDDTFTDWARIATLGLGGRDARSVSDHLDDPERDVAPALMTHARRNLAHPVAQFVVLADISSQFEPENQSSRSPVLTAREQLVAAANLR